MKKIVLFIICSLFFTANAEASYTRNFADEIKIINAVQKARAKIEKYDDSEIFNKLKLAIEKKLDMTDEQIGRSNSMSIKQSSLQEYVLIYFYRNLVNVSSFSTNQKVKIITTDLVKIIAFEGPDNTISVSGNAIYNESYGTNSIIANFWKVPNSQSISKKATIDYINNNILEKEYIGKCSAYEKTQIDNFYLGETKRGVFGIHAIGDYAKPSNNKYDLDIKDCGIYGDSMGISYFSYIGNDILMFSPIGQGYNPIIYDLVETVKKK